VLVIELAGMTLWLLGWAKGILFSYECLDVAMLDRVCCQALVHDENFWWIGQRRRPWGDAGTGGAI